MLKVSVISPEASLYEGDATAVVAPAFDAKRAVLIDDRWATAREDLARLWLGTAGDVAVESFAGAGNAVAAQAQWWKAKADYENKTVLAETFGRIADIAVASEDKGQWADDVAVVTGGSKGSIAAAVTAQLLAGGATVFVVPVERFEKL